MANGGAAVIAAGCQGPLRELQKMIIVRKFSKKILKDFKGWQLI